jgi:hypothetical protein
MDHLFGLSPVQERGLDYMLQPRHVIDNPRDRNRKFTLCCTIASIPSGKIARAF